MTGVVFCARNMRGKNIFSELPIEEVPETDKLKSMSFENEKRAAPRNRNKQRKKNVSKNVESANIKEFSKLSISKQNLDDQKTEKAEKNPSNVASIVHKKVTGANNWEAFLEKSTQLGLINAKEKNELLLNVEMNDENASSKKVNNCVAIDCEMVGIGEGGKENMLARVSIVNSFGECLYDTFVKPTATITDYRTPVSGVRACDLVNAERFSVVQKKVLDLLRGKILVGHAVYNDLIVLKIRHPRHNIRDTTRFKKFYSIGSGTPSLKKLTSHFLKVDIQCGEHNSIQDAQAAMQLYMLYRKEWEADLRKRRHIHLHHQTKKKSKPSHKPKRFGKNYKK